MRLTSELMREYVKRTQAFDVRMELFKDVEVVRLLRLSLSSCDFGESLDGTDPEIYDYDRFVFFKMLWRGEQAADLLERMQAGQAFETGGYSTVVWNANAAAMEFDVHRVFSGQWYGLRKRPYPFDLYESTSEIENLPQYNAYQSLNCGGVPYFPTLQDAEAFFLFDRFLEGMTPSRKQIQIAIDDRRVKFERIIVTRLGLNISLTGDDMSGCELKLFGKQPGMVDVIPVGDENEIEIPLETMPADLTVSVSRGTEIIDQRYISDKQSMFAPTDGVTVERDEQTSIEGVLMLKGENQFVDFKQEYTDKLLSTICAFANAEGGSVFVGISDEGDIIGIQENWDLLRQRIENAMADRMLGHVTVNYIPYTMPNQQTNKVILEARVSEAEAKPIALRDGDKEKYYLRRDGTNRIMKRDDWAHLIRTQRPVQIVHNGQPRF